MYNYRMVLNIPLSAATEARLKAKAKAAGVDVATYAARHLELMAAPPRPLRELSGPIAEAFAADRMTEEELAAFLESEKHAMRAQRRAGRTDE